MRWWLRVWILSLKVAFEIFSLSFLGLHYVAWICLNSCGSSIARVLSYPWYVGSYFLDQENHLSVH